MGTIGPTGDLILEEEFLCWRVGHVLILLASAKLSSKRLNPFRLSLVVYQTLKQQSPAAPLCWLGPRFPGRWF